MNLRAIFFSLLLLVFFFLSKRETSTPRGNKWNKRSPICTNICFVISGKSINTGQLWPRWIPQLRVLSLGFLLDGNSLYFPFFIQINSPVFFPFFSKPNSWGFFFLEMFHFSFPGTAEGEGSSPQLWSNPIKCNLIAGQTRIRQEFQQQINQNKKLGLTWIFLVSS